MTTQLEIRDYSSADIDQVWNWTPDSPEEVFFQLEIEVGEAGKPGATLFQLVVATHEGLSAFKHRYQSDVPKHGLFVFAEYSWEALVERLQNTLVECSKDDWDKSLSCLRKQFLWEYEDYYTDP